LNLFDIKTFFDFLNFNKLLAFIIIRILANGVINLLPPHECQVLSL